VTGAGTRPIAVPDVVADARLHTILRFAATTSGTFVLGEIEGWYPTFLAPLLAGVLLANLPIAPPPKVAFALVAIQAAGAYAAYILTSLLHESPMVLFATIALILFISFAQLAQGRGFLPILLSLISFSTIPVVTMMAPQQAGALPLAFTRAMLLAVLGIWIAYAIWPKIAPPQSKPGQAAFDYPVAMALTGVAIVLPLMLVYLMYGITDALPLLITTIVLVINFDPRKSAAQGMAMMIGNIVGGAVALTSFMLLQIEPSLSVLALISFLIAIVFAIPVERGGPGGAVGLITFNQAMVLLSLSLASGGGGLWLTRVFQFGMACTFAIGMMSLLFPLLRAVRQRAERRASR
jgi:hypothetical protein